MLFTVFVQVYILQIRFLLLQLCLSFFFLSIALENDVRDSDPRGTKCSIERFSFSDLGIHRKESEFSQ